MGQTGEKDQKSTVRLAAKTAVIIAGLTVYALGVALFILPMDMIAAGTTGLALVAEHLWGIPLPGFVAAFNIAMFLLGWYELGREFALTTLIATFYYPIALGQVQRMVGDYVLTEDPMLCAVFAGLMIGFSLGVVIRAGASTGGLDIPPLVLKKRFGVPVSASLYVIDFAVLLSQMAFGGGERVLYGLVMVMTYTIVLDKVLMMGVRQVQVKIISERYEEISLAVQEKLDRGTTLLHMEGGHTRRPSMAVLTVISGRELARLNDMVNAIDDQAFMIVNQVGEVRGRGFTLKKKYEQFPA